MTRLLCILFLLVPYVHAFSQITFLDSDTAVWRFRGFVHFGPCFHHDWQYMLTNQDTTVGNLTYRKMLQLGHEQVYFDCVEPPLGSTSPQTVYPLLAGLIREEGQKVYYWPTSYPSEYLAYDFNQQVGDTVPLYLPYKVIIQSIDSIVIYGRSFNKFNLTLAGIPVDALIEGIGTITFPFLTGQTPVQSVELVCYSRNDSTYYQTAGECGYWPHGQVTSIRDVNMNSGMVKYIYPNPATMEVNIQFGDKGDYTVDIYDSTGYLNKKATASDFSKISFDVSTMSDGVYLLYIRQNEKLISIEKLVVLH